MPRLLRQWRQAWSGRVQQPNIMLRKRYRNIVLPEPLQDGLIQFSLGRLEAGDLNPWLDRDGHRRLGEAGDANERFRLLEHVRMAAQEVTDRRQRLRDVRIVRHADREVEPADVAEIVQDLSDDFSIWDHNARPVGMHERRREDIDLHDVAVNAQYGDMFADAIGLGKNDR